MANHGFEAPRVASRDVWLLAHKALMAQEKALTRERDRLAAERRALPWLRVEKRYSFDGPNGVETLEQLFGGRS